MNASRIMAMPFLFLRIFLIFNLIFDFCLRGIYVENQNGEGGAGIDVVIVTIVVVVVVVVVIVIVVTGTLNPIQ